MLVYKYPHSDFSTMSQLIVRESQEAILYKDGKMLGAFLPGKYTLHTGNIPLLSKLVKIGAGVLLLIGYLLSNMAYLSAWMVIQGVLTSALLGVIVGGIPVAFGNVLSGTVAAKDRIIQKDLSGKYNKINGELQQIDQEIRKIEPGKKENEEVCASIDSLERDLEVLRKRLYKV